MNDIEVNLYIPKEPSQSEPSGREKKQQKKMSFIARKQKKAEMKQRFKSSAVPQTQEDEELQIEQRVQDLQQMPARVDRKQRGPRELPKDEVVEDNLFELPQVNDDDKVQKQVSKEFKFADLDYISPQVRKGLAESNYVNLTEIQIKAIPEINQKKNAIIRSVTGSGKTLAYMVPLYNQLCQSEKPINRDIGTLILIICPVRELALQCIDVASKCGKRCPFVVQGGLLGGENPKKEKARLRKGVTILIGTPGRIVYHLKNTTSLKYDKLQAIVFEEWDRLLDMGFKNDIEEIIQTVSQKCDYEKVQKILVSAHATTEIASIEGLKINPDQFTLIGFNKEDVVAAHRKHKAKREDWLGDETWAVPSTLSQYYTFIEDRQKVSFLLAYVIAQRTKKAIIFVATCDEVEYYAYLLENLRHPQRDEKIFQQFQTFKLHGNIEQKTRSKTYFSFRQSLQSAVLISTSVASRGLDFPDVSSILLFDPPDGKDDYINKVGRTARIDQFGSSLLVLCENNNTRNFIQPLSQEMGIQYTESSNYWHDFQIYLKSHERLIEKKPDLYLLQSIRQEVRQDQAVYLMARRAYISFIRAYSRLKDLKAKAMSLHDLCKSFGLDKAIGTETKDEKYQRELIKTNREKFREQGVELNSSIWENVRKQRKVTSEKDLNKMEFV